MPNDSGTGSGMGPRGKAGEISGKESAPVRESKTGESALSRSAKTANQMAQSALRSTNDALQPFSAQLKKAEAFSNTAAKRAEKFARETGIADAAQFVQKPGEKTAQIVNKGINEQTRETVRQALRKADQTFEPFSGTLKKTEAASRGAARAAEQFAERSGLARVAQTVREGQRGFNDVKNLERDGKVLGRALKSSHDGKDFTREAARIEKQSTRKTVSEKLREQPSRRLEGAEREAAEARLEAVRKRLEHVETRLLGDPKAGKDFLRNGISRDRQPERHAKVEALWNKLKGQERVLERDLHLNRLQERLPGLRAEMKQSSGQAKARLRHGVETTERRIEELQSDWKYRKDVRDDWKFVKTERNGKEYALAFGKLSKPSEIINWRRDSAVGKRLDSAARRGEGKDRDHAGHLAALRFGADPRETINLTSQNSKMNTGRGWADVESGLATRAEQDPSGSLRVRIESVRKDGRETHRNIGVKQGHEAVAFKIKSGPNETTLLPDNYIAGNFKSPRVRREDE